MSTSVGSGYTDKIIFSVVAGLVIWVLTLGYKKIRAWKHLSLVRGKEEIDLLKQASRAARIYAHNLRKRQDLNQIEYDRMTPQQKHELDLCERELQAHEVDIMNGLGRARHIESRYNSNLKKLAEKIHAQKPWDADDLELFYQLYECNKKGIERKIERFEVTFPA